MLFQAPCIAYVVPEAPEAPAEIPLVERLARLEETPRLPLITPIHLQLELLRSPVEVEVAAERLPHSLVAVVAVAERHIRVELLQFRQQIQEMDLYQELAAGPHH